MRRNIKTTNDETIGEDLIALLVDEHRSHTRPTLQRLWDYYRNELDFTSGDEHRPYRAAQQRGLPDRLTRTPAGSGRAARSIGVGGGRREVVIENDIAWRVHTLVDFMFGRPVVIESLAADRERAKLIERVLEVMFENNGGVCFFQDMALLGSVYGFVDVMLRADRLPAVGGADGVRAGKSSADRAASSKDRNERAVRYASRLILETVEAPRAIPVPDPSDYRRLVGYVLHYTQVLNRVEKSSFLSRLVKPMDSNPWASERRATVDVTEVWTDRSVRVYHDGALAEEMVNVLGRLPVVHVQNLPQPFVYEGLSEVEPLIPLQDELNTRLSDRANRVTMQSFKMYLGKGIEKFTERPIGPGQMWMTENPEASIEAFGGDGANPSEESHIGQIREAMDKASAVTAAAAGMLRNRVGHLTSENAMRIVMMGLLNRTEKKRVGYGKGIERVVEMVLHAMDVAGVLPTEPEERRVRLHWPSPVPENQTRRLEDAVLKLQVGVPRERVLAELGYGVD